MSSPAQYKRLIGLEVYSLDAKHIGRITDVGLYMNNENQLGVYIVISKDEHAIGVPISSIKAIGDIVLLSNDYKNNLVAVTESKENQVQREQVVGTIPRIPENPVASQAEPTKEKEIVIPRCPHCGSALIYDVKKRKWYCPRCKKHVKLPALIESRVPRCPYCGLPLSYIEQYDKWYCYNCKRYVEIEGH